MNDVQQSRSSIMSLDNLLFQRVVQYLDSKSITQLVLVNREMRLKVGDVFSRAKTLLYPQLDKYFNEIDYVLEQFASTFVLDHYFKIVLLIKHNNINFFSTLYSLILNKQINITSQDLNKQKKGLIQLGPNILYAFEQMRITQTLPSINFDETNLQINPLQLGFNGQKYQLFKLISIFTESLIKIKSSGKGIQDYKYYKQLQKYLKNTRLKQPENLQIYQNQIYYTSKKMLDVLNKNTISLIFQFLQMKDILKMRLLNKWFYHQIPSFMQTSINFITNNVEILYQNLINFDKNLIDLIKKNMQFNTVLNRTEIRIMMAIKNPPQIILAISNLLLEINCLNVKYERDQNAFIKLLRYNNNSVNNFTHDQSSIYNDHYYKQFSGEEMQKIEKYLEQYSFERITQCSYAMSRVYLNIQINYLLNKSNISKQLYHGAIKARHKSKYLVHYQRFYNKLIQKQDQLSLHK